MKVLSPQDTNHIISLIPRFDISGEFIFELYNETTQVTETINNTYSYSDGIAVVSFNYNFVEGSKYQIKIIESGVVIYRDKLFIMAQETQEFKSSNGLYYYE